MQKRWFSRPRFVGSRSTGSPFLMMHTWCSPVRVEYSSRAPSRSAIQSRQSIFLSICIFARETQGKQFLSGFRFVFVVCVHFAKASLVENNVRLFFQYSLCCLCITKMNTFFIGDSVEVNGR